MSGNALHFQGAISKVTPDGRSGVVTLDIPVEGKAYAIITPDTSGRVDLMNGKGSLAAGTRVEGEGTLGVDALKAITVAQVK